jgi:hypothetical protein
MSIPRFDWCGGSNIYRLGKSPTTRCWDGFFIFVFHPPFICIFLSSVFLSPPPPYKLTMTILPLSYEVAHCSSWDEDRSPEQLVNSSPGNRSSDTPLLNPEEELRNVKVKGWQTPK